MPLSELVSTGKKLSSKLSDFYLMDSLSVEENIMLPMILGREKPELMKNKAKKFHKGSGYNNY